MTEKNKPTPKKSNWITKASFRRHNRKWLEYSSQIARRVAAAMEAFEDLNQTKLAERLEVSPQYISKVLKGHENLSLETIAKLSTALKTELIHFPDYKDSVHQYFPLTCQAITAGSLTSAVGASTQSTVTMPFMHFEYRLSGVASLSQGNDQPAIAHLTMLQQTLSLSKIR